MPRDSLKKVAVFTSVVLLVSGCGGDKSSVSPDSPAEVCSGRIAVTASAGLTPTFSWSPACKVEGLFVVRTDAPATAPALWSAGAAFHYFGPDVQYGVAPTGVPSSGTPTPLEAGVQYRVSVSVMVGGDVQTASGTATFVP